MSAVLIKGLPAIVHRQLKNEALVHRRSLNQEIIWRLEQSVTKPTPVVRLNGIVPFKPRHPLTNEIITRARRWGRE